MATDALVLDAPLTSIGRYRGALFSVRPDDRAAPAIATIVENPAAWTF